MSLQPFSISPPLLNTANPSATTPEDLSALYNSPNTGAITIRTSLLKGFPHSDSVNQYTLFDTVTGRSDAVNTVSTGARDWATSSLNTLGYSPHIFSYYETLLQDAAEGKAGFKPRLEKPIIVSVTGTAEEVAEMYTRLHTLQGRYPSSLRIFVEVNLSCPNISGKPPPAYNMSSLTTYLSALSSAISKSLFTSGDRLHVGLKLPPYTYSTQFTSLISTLEDAAKTSAKKYQEAWAYPSPVSFLTATNTLGSSLVLMPSLQPSLASVDGSGIGGLAGVSIHALSLGNVRTLRSLLDRSTEESVKGIKIIGVGGVRDRAGYERMRSVGAEAVGVATAVLGRGVGVFGEILGEGRAKL